jgi:hypothetical protein
LKAQISQSQKAKKKVFHNKMFCVRDSSEKPASASWRSGLVAYSPTRLLAGHAQIIHPRKYLTPKMIFIKKKSQKFSNQSFKFFIIYA